MASIWTYIEPTVAIISACLPFFSKFFADGAKKISSRSKSRRNMSSFDRSDPANGTITKRTTTIVSDEAKHNQHELTSYSVRVGARPDGRVRLGSESDQSLV